MTDARKYRLVLFGATGFTGGLCADYLAQHLPNDTAWAIAGRNRDKLKQVVARLALGKHNCLPEIIEADINNDVSIKHMAESTRTVITTVGPYIYYGEGLVRACAQAGTHYCDLTGEPEFVNNMIVRYHDLAKQNNAAIVNCCGFDSIPHDLGAFFTVRELEKANGAKLHMPVSVEGGVSANGTFSGGTWQSALTAMSRVRENKNAMGEAKKALKKAYPTERKVGSTSFIPRRVDDFGGWLIPLPTIDPYMVQRSARAMEEYGPDFHYGHFIVSQSLPKALAGIAGIGGLIAGVQIKPIRERLLKFRQSGEGPSEEKRANSWFRVRFIGTAGDLKVVCDVSGGDPGYSETAKMLAETGMALALDEGYPKRSGVVTPTMALEERLIERLQQAGIRFERVRKEHA